MNFKKFFEMTFSAGKQDFSLDPDIADSWTIGNFNGFDIRFRDGYFFIIRDGQLAGWMKTSPSSYGEVIEAIRVLPEFRRQHLAENLLFWVKSYLKKSILFGDTMSDDAISWLKGLTATGRFKIYWLNIETGERHPYNGAMDGRLYEPYRSQLSPTAWRVFLEAYNGDFFLNKYSEWNTMGAITDLFAFF
jgi:hypothetical protein